MQKITDRQEEAASSPHHRKLTILIHHLTGAGRFFASKYGPAIALMAAFISIAWAGLFAQQAEAKNSAPFGPVDKVVVVVLDRVSPVELTGVPALEPLLDEAAVGVISSPVAGSPSPSKFFLSLGTGNIAGGSWVRESAYQEDEPFKGGTAGERYASRAGRTPPAGSIVELDIFSILRTQPTLPRRPITGYLGEALKTNGHKVALVGNSDHLDPDLIRREPINIRNSALMVMDSQGIIPAGEVGPRLNSGGAGSITGITTNNRALKLAVRKALSRADLVVVELGQTTRLEVYNQVLTEERENKLKKEAIAEAAGLIGSFRRMAGPNSRFIILSPTPPNRQGRFIGMSPILIVGEGVSPGVLTSPTTRRAGLIGNVDFAPTILSWFGVQRTPDLPGRPVELSQRDDSSQKAFGLEERSAAIYQLREPFVTGVLLLCFAVFAGAVLYARSSRKKEIHKNLICAGALTVMAIPSACLLAAPLLSPMNPGVFVSGLIFVALALAFLAWLARRLVHPVVTLGLLTIAVPLIDLLFGAGLMFDGILSYSPVYGARFYGIGNEAMSIMLGALLIVVPVLFGKRAERLGGVMLYSLIGFILALVFFTGFPDLGANMGGTVTVGITGGIALLLWVRGRLSLPGVAVVITIVMAALVGLIALDASRSEFAQSHLGRTGDMVAGLGIFSLIPVALRKALAGVSYSSDWLAPLGLLVVAAIASSTDRPKEMVKDLFERLPLLKGAVSAVLIGGIVGLLSNDSGIMVPALMLIYFVAGMLVVATLRTPPTDSKDTVIS